MYELFYSPRRQRTRHFSTLCSPTVIRHADGIKGEIFPMQLWQKIKVMKRGIKGAAMKADYNKRRSFRRIPSNKRVDKQTTRRTRTRARFGQSTITSTLKLRISLFVDDEHVFLQTRIGLYSSKRHSLDSSHHNRSSEEACTLKQKRNRLKVLKMFLSILLK